MADFEIFSPRRVFIKYFKISAQFVFKASLVRLCTMSTTIKCDFKVNNNRKLLDFIENSIPRVILWCRRKIRI